MGLLSPQMVLSVLPVVVMEPPNCGIWNKKSLLKNSNQKSWDTRKVPHQSVPPSAGHPMDKPSSPDTLITSSVSGHSLFHVPLPKRRPTRDSNLSVWKIG